MNRLNEFLKRLDELNPNGTAEQLDGICGGGQDSIILIQDHPRPFKDVAVVHDLHDAWLMQHLYNNRHYLASILRAGRECREALQQIEWAYEFPWEKSSVATTAREVGEDYDAVEGTQPEVDNDAD